MAKVSNFEKARTLLIAEAEKLITSAKKATKTGQLDAAFSRFAFSSKLTAALDAAEFEKEEK